MGLRFDIQPYVGALPVAFGMTRKQVHQLLGPPESSTPKSSDSGVVDYYHNANVGYTLSGKVFHCGFCPGVHELLIGGRPLWGLKRQPDPNPTLLALDPNPLELVGFWFYVAIGVTTTGYHDGDRSQRAVTAFVRGKDAELLTRAKPADTSRYGRG